LTDDLPTVEAGKRSISNMTTEEAQNAILVALYRLEKPYRERGQTGQHYVSKIANESGVADYRVRPQLQELCKQGLCSTPYVSTPEGGVPMVQSVNELTDLRRQRAEHLIVEDE
jgi:hypothetical protein